MCGIRFKPRLSIRQVYLYEQFKAICIQSRYIKVKQAFFPSYFHALTYINLPDLYAFEAHSKFDCKMVFFS